MFVLFHLNQPLIEYSSGNAYSSGEMISLASLFKASNFLDVSIKTTSLALLQTGAGYGLHVTANFLNYSTVSMNAPYPILNTNDVNCPLNAGYCFLSEPPNTSFK